jgi:hypothetical protein
MVLLHDERRDVPRPGQMEQIALDGTGRTDELGTTSFEFEVTAGGSLVGFAASTEQGRYGWAELAGTIRSNAPR